MRFLTIKEAAQAAGVSVDTIKRRLRDGYYPGAFQGLGTGNRSAPWQIPVSELAASRLAARPQKVITSQDQQPDVRVRVLEALVGAQQAHIDDLRAELHRHAELLAQAMSHLGMRSRPPDPPPAPNEESIG